MYARVKNVPRNPADDGFVFSTEQLDRKLDFVVRMARARAEKWAEVSDPEIDSFVYRIAA